MQIHFKAQADYDAFFFCDLSGPTSIRLPENILVADFLLLIQGSLDQIKPVVLLNHEENLSAVKLSELKSQHFKLEKNQFVFLNFSIRNSLSTFDSSLTIVKSFDEIHDYFSKNLQK